MSHVSIITGGAGFIGSHLAERLLAAGDRVVLIDNLSTGRRRNVEPLLGENCRLVVADAAEAIGDGGVVDGATRIFHLAAAVGVKLVVDQPLGHGPQQRR